MVFARRVFTPPATGALTITNSVGSWRVLFIYFCNRFRRHADEIEIKTRCIARHSMHIAVPSVSIGARDRRHRKRFQVRAPYAPNDPTVGTSGDFERGVARSSVGYDYFLNERVLSRRKSVERRS